MSTERTLSERHPERGHAEHIVSGAVSTCSVCGRVAADDGLEDTNGWRWYSDGRGGLRSLCATCPVPTSVSVQDS